MNLELIAVHDEVINEKSHLLFVVWGNTFACGS